jgi:hypothetical protein
MLTTLKTALKKTPLGEAWLRFRAGRRAVQDIAHWETRGRPVPSPHAYKIQTVRRYARQFATPVLVETGSFMGDMVFAVKNSFAVVYTIELDHDLHCRVQARFAGDPRVRTLRGDSSRVLAEVLPHIKEPCLFWLDAHYSGGITARGTVDTPIMTELRQILGASIPGAVILIDDAHCFVGENDYPTLEALRQFVRENRPTLAFEVQDDIIRLYDPSTSR